jgi:SAM-dependent methyltransferase
MAERPGAAASAARDDWDRHWSDYADVSARNPAQAYRRRLVVSLLGEPPAPGRVLDIGCGSGELAAAVRRAFPGSDIVGLDTSAAGLELARRKLPAATFLQRDLLEPAEPEPRLRNWATHAVCSEVLEHLEDPGDLLRNVQAYMAPGCRLIVTVPGGPMSTYDRHIGHRAHYTGKELASVLKASGFRVERTRAAGFPFFNLYRLAVIAGGARVIEEAAAGRQAPGLTNIVMRSFTPLFRLNLRRSPWGWQIVAVARLP